MDYRTGSHTKYKIEYHFVWVTKYRYHVLTGEIALRARELVRQTCAMLEVEIVRGVTSYEFKVLFFFARNFVVKVGTVDPQQLTLATDTEA